MTDDTQWRNQRNTVLNWWPQILAGEKPQGYMFVDALEDTAWGCQSEVDWSNWLGQVQKIWPNYVFMEPLHHRREGTDGIEVHLGPSLGQALFEVIHSETPVLSLKTRARTPPSRHTLLAETTALAERLRNEFALKEVVASRSSEPLWLKKQLTDAYLGFASIATLLDIPHHAIGAGALRIWLHEKSPIKGATSSSSQHIEIHQSGGNIAQTWAWWKLARNQHIDFSTLGARWMRGFGKSPRMVLEHQNQFLDKSQQAYKRLMEQVPVTSEMGQRVFRRYRALCKWTDDIRRGSSLESIQQTWEKLKTGNRIAWSGEHTLGYDKIIKNWSWEERVIENAFWRAPRWDVPAWVQRYQALASDSTRSHSLVFSEEEYMALWTIGFEGFIREKMGYDGWTAMSHICHPMGKEAEDFHSFLQEYLFPLIQNQR